MEYIATFFTHTGAVKYKKYMQKLGIQAELMPVPRRLSSDCGIAARFEADLELASLIAPDVEKLFLIEHGGERLVYSADG
ncbi:DUF3343 domain-containing protein [Candidatus Darwinibacter acetoxidans]|jgi:hypothetical protein